MIPWEPSPVLVISGLGLLVGIGLGLGGLVWPGWASRLVGLTTLRDEGFAEFRATYGGMFLFGHMAGALLLFKAVSSTNDISWALVAAGGALALGAGWIGTALGRLASMYQEKTTNTQFNQGSTLFEAAVGLAIAAPWLVLLF
jgi:hypothetical protein